MDKATTERIYKTGYHKALRLCRAETVEQIEKDFNDFWEKESLLNDLIVTFKNSPPEIRADILAYAEFLAEKRKKV